MSDAGDFFALGEDIRPHGRKSIPHRRPRWSRKDAGFMRARWEEQVGQLPDGGGKKRAASKNQVKVGRSHKSWALIKGRRRWGAGA